jgi:subtilisin family serine protease
MELWYPGSAALRLELVSPEGRSVGILEPGESGTASQGGQVLLFAANRLSDPNNGDNTIGVFVAPSLSPGRWILRLTSTTGDPVPFHAWIERDDNGQSTFEAPLDNTHTIGSISCGHNTIVVGSYDAHKPALPLSWFSSAGPTRDGRRKPEVSAPGHNVRAAASRTVTGSTRMSGTSMASPAVTGCVALLLAEAAAQNRSLTAAEIRSMAVRAARSDPPVGGAWDDRYGAGRVSAAGMIALL